jgi:hypothetical protein
MCPLMAMLTDVVPPYLTSGVSWLPAVEWELLLVSGVNICNQMGKTAFTELAARLLRVIDSIAPVVMLC